MKSPLLERVCASIVCKSSPLLVVMMCLLASISASPVLAQDEPLRPPTTRDAPSAPKYIVLAIALLLAGLVVFVATLKSKRGHQD